MTVPTITDDLVAELEQSAKASSLSCCGNWGVGGEYMGSTELVCCGSPNVDPADMTVDSSFILALLAERAELKRKSRRYDFIRDQHNYEFSDIGVSNGNLFLAREDGELDLDSSIDELMEAMQEQPK